MGRHEVRSVSSSDVAVQHCYPNKHCSGRRRPAFDGLRSPSRRVRVYPPVPCCGSPSGESHGLASLALRRSGKQSTGLSEVHDGLASFVEDQPSTVPHPQCRSNRIHSGDAGFHRLSRLLVNLARPRSIRGAERTVFLELLRAREENGKLRVYCYALLWVVQAAPGPALCDKLRTPQGND